MTSIGGNIQFPSTRGYDLMELRLIRSLTTSRDVGGNLFDRFSQFVYCL